MDITEILDEIDRLVSEADLDNLDTEERVSYLEAAKRLASTAQDLVAIAVEGTAAETQFEAYGIGLDQALGEGNPYDLSIDKLVQQLEEGGQGS